MTHDEQSEEDRLAERRCQVARLHAQGKSGREIALAVGVSASTASRDLDYIREQWRTQATADMAGRVNAELAVLDEVARQAWEGWHRSIGRHVRKVERIGRTDGKAAASVETVSEELAGAVEFLNTIVKCSERRAKILGLDAPKQLNVGVTGGALVKFVAGEFDPVDVV